MLVMDSMFENQYNTMCKFAKRWFVLCNYVPPYGRRADLAKGRPCADQVQRELVGEPAMSKGLAMSRMFD